MRPFVRFCGITLCVFGLFAAPDAGGQCCASNQEWIAYKTKCGLPSSMVYNDWAKNPSCPANSSPAGTAAAPTTLNPALGNAAQSVGYALGQQLGKVLFGDPAAKAAAEAAQRQRELAARQRSLNASPLNNSGIYLMKQRNYAGAINEFQQALAIAPDDANIRFNLATAERLLKESGVAARNSSALGQVLGDAPVRVGNVNLNALDRSATPTPNGSALNLVNLFSDASVVDLSNATSAVPQSLKTQLDGILTNRAPATEPPDPLVQLPQASDIELLFQSPAPAESRWPGPQRPANEPKLVNPSEEDAKTAITLTEIDKILDKQMNEDMLLQMDDATKLNKTLDKAANEEMQRRTDSNDIDRIFDKAANEEMQERLKKADLPARPEKQTAPASTAGPHN